MNNKDDGDDDGDGVDDDTDACPRDAEDTCEDDQGGGGGEPAPADLPPEVTDAVAQVQAAVAGVVAQLPPVPALP